MTRWSLLALFLAAALPVSAAQEQPEPKKIPKDSVEVLATGCLKGRAFTAIPPREAETQRGPDVSGRTFRVAGKKDLMREVKAMDGKLVQITGIVRIAALADNQPGRRIGNTRVVIGSPGGSDPLARPTQGPIVNVTVMDLTSIRFVDSVCPIPH
jgi:hypothetical protein